MKKEELEQVVNQFASRIEQFGGRIERGKVTHAQLEKAFAFVQRKLDAVHERARAVARAPAEAFSMEMTLEPLPAMPAPAISYPPGVRAAAPLPAQAAERAPTASGLTVEGVGGRFVSEARGERYVAGTRGSTAIDGVDFLDDDEDIAAGNPTGSDEGISFMDED